MSLKLVVVTVNCCNVRLPKTGYLSGKAKACTKKASTLKNGADESAAVTLNI